MCHTMQTITSPPLPCPRPLSPPVVGCLLLHKCHQGTSPQGSRESSVQAATRPATHPVLLEVADEGRLSQRVPAGAAHLAAVIRDGLVGWPGSEGGTWRRGGVLWDMDQWRAGAWGPSRIRAGLEAAFPHCCARELHGQASCAGQCAPWLPPTHLQLPHLQRAVQHLWGRKAPARQHTLVGQASSAGECVRVLPVVSR